MMNAFYNFAVNGAPQVPVAAPGYMYLVAQIKPNPGQGSKTPTNQFPDQATTFNNG